MPIDDTSALDRIKDKLSSSDVKMGKILSESEIAAFEKKHNVRLPWAYRMFLLTVGDGCESMIDGFPLKRLSDTECGDLSKPFEPEDTWIWEDDGSTAEEIARKAYSGVLELIDIGDGMGFYLIVSGKCQGEVWFFTDVGVQPLRGRPRPDFICWFELWLDKRNDVDGFMRLIIG